MQKLSRAEILIILLFAALAAGYRLAYLRGPLDEPSWRQSWCSYQARQLARESPPELLHVKINYKGTNDVSVWNFPLYEGIVGVTYKAMGVDESLPVARVITLLFFAGAVFYLYKSAALLLGQRTAAYSALAYAWLPVGLFYSRAVHYDIVVLFLSHAFFYFGLRFLDDRKPAWYVAATVAAALAFAVKPPYCFYFGLPLLVYALTARERKPWRELLLIGGLFVLPLLAGWAMHAFRLSLEGAQESSILYPDPYTKGYARNWYFGGLGLRLDTARWLLLGRSVFWLVLTPLGAFAASWALLTAWGTLEKRGWWTLLALAAGVAGFVLLLFPLVTAAHSYYLLPLMAPAALMIGVFLNDLGGGASWRAKVRMGLCVAVLAAGAGWGVRRGSFFVVDWQRIKAGQAIREHTGLDDLVVSTAQGRSTAHTDPRILYFADRRGWAIPFEKLTAEALRTYTDAGARVLAVLVTPERAAESREHPLLSKLPCTSVPLTDDGGDPIGSLMLFDLSAGGGQE
ncbi:MAG: glycosyltransferase family 39 protein [Kiritimatiellae bacterium]|nr:glycosyltransferase family 39 protein [Kiritimatiellia bacterium]